MDFNLNQITAAEAYSIASGEHENQKRIEENLNIIYSKIHSAIKDGDMDVDVSFYIIQSGYMQILSSILEEKGFRISFGYNEYDGEDYINISWKHIGNKQ